MFRVPKNQFVENEKNLEEKLINSASDTEKSTLFFRNCEQSNFTVKGKFTKIMIENCTGVKFNFSDELKVVTSILEIWNSNVVEFDLSAKIHMIQVDNSRDLRININSKENFSELIWNNSDEILIKVLKKKNGDKGKESEEECEDSTLTGLINCKSEVFNEFDMNLDQCVVNYDKQSGKLKQNLVYRTGCGHVALD
ncbi:hypothetical protein HDU92_002439 [Lobulomyces angularis]|nr:hypothetical protein HDU92_002439 [Lobulomyces angularis]